LVASKKQNEVIKMKNQDLQKFMDESLARAKLNFKFRKSIEKQFGFKNLAIWFLSNNPQDIIVKVESNTENLAIFNKTPIKFIQNFLLNEFNHEVKDIGYSI
jgi:hydroxymethylglutaryl-CoA reductase